MVEVSNIIFMLPCLSLVCILIKFMQKFSEMHTHQWCFTVLFPLMGIEIGMEIIFSIPRNRNEK